MGSRGSSIGTGAKMKNQMQKAKQRIAGWKDSDFGKGSLVKESDGVTYRMSELSVNVGALRSTVRRYIAQDGYDPGETIYQMYVGSNTGSKSSVSIHGIGNPTLEKAKSKMPELFNNITKLQEKGYDYKTIEQHTVNEINRLAKQGLTTTYQDLRSNVALSLRQLKNKK